MTTRLLVSDALSNGSELTLAGEQARYVSRVLRLRTGDTLLIFNGDDGEWSATVERIARENVTLQVTQRQSTNTETNLKVHLVQGVSRGERMDFVVQKATELGVKRITPVLTDHGVVKFDEKRASKRRDHWQGIADSATEQCGRIRPPLVDAPIALNRWLGEKDAGDSTEILLRPGATSAFGTIDTPAVKLCLLIGPEGGFSEREYEDAAIAGFAAVSLGPRVLRTETAGLAALAVAQSLWGDLRTNERQA